MSQIELLWCKIFSLKIEQCKILDKYHVCCLVDLNDEKLALNIMIHFKDILTNFLKLSRCDRYHPPQK